jgi:hypothetical protein
VKLTLFANAGDLVQEQEDKQKRLTWHSLHVSTFHILRINQGLLTGASL